MTRRPEPAEFVMAAALEQAGAADVDPERLRAVAARAAGYGADAWGLLAAARQWLRLEVCAEWSLEGVVALGLVDAAAWSQKVRDLAPRRAADDDEEEDDG